MTKNLPPFLQGKEAFLAGQPVTDNPYPEGVLDGDQYPGPHRNWNDGWIFEKKITDYGQQRK